MKNWKLYLAVAALLIAATMVLGIVFAEPVWAQVRAALVKDLDNPARQPFAASNGVATFVDGNISLDDPILTVPAGKRAVVEHLSCVNYLDSVNSWIRFELGFTSGGVPSARQQFVHTRVGQSLIGGIDIWSLSQPVRLYADPSSTINIRALRRIATGSGGVECYVSGYYVDSTL